MNQAVKLAEQSDSVIIVFVVVIVLAIIALIPVMKVLSNAKNTREGLLIKVIEKNTEVNSALKTLIENDQKFCSDCKNQQLQLFRKVFDNQEGSNLILTEIKTTMKKGSVKHGVDKNN